MTAAANVMQLVRAHFQRDETAFASAAMSLARAAKSGALRVQITEALKRGYDRRPGESANGWGQLPKALAPRPENISSLLQALPDVGFVDLMLPTELQLFLDEIVTEIEYRIDLAARKLRPRSRLLFYGPPGNGKCLQIGTLVMRFDGSIVPVESVRIGDLLMGADSTPRTVLGTTRGNGPLYRVTPVKGASWVCNDVHVLTVVDTDTGTVRDVDVQSYLGATQWFRDRSKLFTPEAGIDFPPGADLPIDPYFLGAWYGDGTKARDARGKLACVALTKPDGEIRELAESTAARYGAKVRVQEGAGCATYSISMGNNGRVRRNVLLDQLRAVVGDGTVLPHAYLTASRAHREQFLAGLLDTDGSDNYGGFEIVQKVRGFADGICFLARSLGLRATMVPKIVNGETYWRVTLSGECSMLPLRIARKKAAPRKQIKRVNRTGFTIEPIGSGDYAGFELDGDGRFLLGDFTVTHNSSSASALGNALGMSAYAVSIPRVIGSHIGETGQKLGELFDSLRDGMVIVFDEIDALGGKRGTVDQAASKEMNSTVNTLLTLMDRHRDGIFVATTNRPDILDPALMRRFDEQIHFPEPSHAQMTALAERLCAEHGVAPIDVSGCRNYDEATKLVQREARRAVMREILSTEADAEENDDATDSEAEAVN